MIKFTEKSLRKAMMEQMCSGLEGHSPKDSTYVWDTSNPGFIRVQCKKCKLYVAVHHRELENEIPDPNATPPYVWGDG